MLPSNNLIISTPHDINGLEAAGSDEERLVLGLVLNSAMKEPVIDWYRDSDMIRSGISVCAISVRQPGLCTASVRIAIGDTVTDYMIHPHVYITLAEDSDMYETPLPQTVQ